MLFRSDYGMGNLGSVLNMLKRVRAHDSIITSDLCQIEEAEKLILPGVGSFKKAMQNLDRSGFLPVLKKKVLQEKTPIMGICLGMQLLFEHSEEGNYEGLGWVAGKVVRFSFEENNGQLKVPHMGWNIIKSKKESPLIQNMYYENKFYYVHSYHAICKYEEDILLTTRYGYDFVSGVEKENIYGFQFHPEKSHKYGKKLLENFVNL